MFISSTVLLTQVEYIVEVELNLTDVETVDYLRSLTNNDSFFFALGPIVNLTNINITTGKNGAPAGLNTMGSLFHQMKPQTARVPSM